MYDYLTFQSHSSRDWNHSMDTLRATNEHGHFIACSGTSVAGVLPAPQSHLFTGEKISESHVGTSTHAGQRTSQATVPVALRSDSHLGLGLWLVSLSV